MRGSLIAITFAAVIAGIFTLISEPITGTKNDISAQPLQPAAKGNRLDYRPVRGCSLARQGQNFETGCVSVVDRWSAKTSLPPATA